MAKNRKKSGLFHLLIVLVVLTTLLLLLGRLASLSTAPTTTTYIRGNNVWVAIGSKTKQITKINSPVKKTFYGDSSDVWYEHPIISPNGRLIAYIRVTDAGSDKNISSLYVTSVDGGNMKKLTDNVDWPNNLFAWKGDNDTIYYTYHANHMDILGDPTQIYAVSVATGLNYEVGEYVVKDGGCGGGSGDPAYHLRASEGLRAIERPQVFQLSPDGTSILHTINCFGMGLALLDLKSGHDGITYRISPDLKKGQDSPRYGDTSQGIFSPNGKEVAAINHGIDKILVFDTNSGNLLKTASTSAYIDSMMWSFDGDNIYYTTSTAYSKINDFSIWKTQIEKLDLKTLQVKRVAEFKSHGIRLIGISKDMKTLIISFVENSDNYASHFNQDADNNYLAQFVPKVNLAQVDETTGKLKILIRDAKQASYFP